MHSEISYNLITEKWGGDSDAQRGNTGRMCGRIPAAERRAVKRMRPGRRAKGDFMICTKCNASIPNGASSCPECKAKFEKHVGAFAGSVHWEDEVRIRESPRTKKRKIIVYSVILALVIAFWLLVQTGALGAIMEEIGWRYVRMVYPLFRYGSPA